MPRVTCFQKRPHMGLQVPSKQPHSLCLCLHHCLTLFWACCKVEQANANGASALCQLLCLAVSVLDLCWVMAACRA